MIITEPRWKSFIVETTQPIFTPKQCQMIIDAGRAEPRQNASVGNSANTNSTGSNNATLGYQSNFHNVKF